MCIMFALPRGVVSPEEELRNGSINNRDGYGYAIAHKGELIIEKSFKWQELLPKFIKLRAELGNPPAIWHARIATHGTSKANTDNLHPFLVGATDNKTVMAHNGILPAAYQWGDAHNISDTRAFVYSLVSGQFNAQGVPSRSQSKAMAQQIGTGNKLLFLSASGKIRIINEKAGTWVKGVWASNSGFCSYYDRYVSDPRWANKRASSYLLPSGKSELSVRDSLNPYGSAAWDYDDMAEWDEDFYSWSERRDTHSSNCTCDGCWFDTNYPRDKYTEAKASTSYYGADSKYFDEFTVTNAQHNEFLELSEYYTKGTKSKTFESDYDCILELIDKTPTYQLDALVDSMAFELHEILMANTGDKLHSPLTWGINRIIELDLFTNNITGPTEELDPIEFKTQEALNTLIGRWADMYYMATEEVESFFSDYEDVRADELVSDKFEDVNRAILSGVLPNVNEKVKVEVIDNTLVLGG